MVREFFNRYLRRFEKEFDTLNRIEISREAILHNYDLYQSLNSETKIFPVLKSNAYGHGLMQVAEILKERNPEYVVVDSYYEALKLRIFLNLKILIIGYTKPANFRKMRFKNMALTVYDIKTIRALGNLNKNINIHLKIDTGMCRQGIKMNEVGKYLKLIKEYKKLNLEGVMSHLADADGEDDEFFNLQNQRFNKVVEFIRGEGFNPKYIHLANSAGSLKKRNVYANAARVGLGLYGYHCFKKESEEYKKVQNLKPVLKFISTIVCAKEIYQGDKVSYNCSYQAKEKMRIGILPVGYYEGVSRRLSNKGFFTKDDHQLSIIGRVCMNLTIVDLKNSGYGVGEELIVIDNNPNSINSVSNIAKQIDTIPYIITTSLSESIRRVTV